jgi:anthranilate phosphoribosyltransferase
MRKHATRSGMTTSCWRSSAPGATARTPQYFHHGVHRGRLRGREGGKHGNRAASSKSGAADCLEALGVNISLTPQKVWSCWTPSASAFSSPRTTTLHEIRRPGAQGTGCAHHLQPPGPAHQSRTPRHPAAGVYSEALVEPLAHVLQNLGVRRGMVCLRAG